VATFRILSVEFSILTLMGTLSLANGSRNVGLNPGAVLSCHEVNMVDVIPRTSQDGIQLAEVMILLDAYPTPGLEWRNPIGPQDRFNSLADVFRCAYSHLEDDGGNLDTRSPSSQNLVPTFTTRKIDLKGSITDSLVMTGSLLATGASLATPVGAAVSVVALGAKDSIVAAASKGQASRGGEGYKLGDVTRGIVSSIHQQRQHLRKGNEQAEDDSVISRDSNPPPEPEFPSALESNHHRYVGVLGSSAGAAAGMVIAGPIGLLAGSLIGNVVTRDVLHRRKCDQELEHPSVSSRRLSTQEPSESSSLQYQWDQDDHSQVEGWKFGDNIRNVVQRGKVSNGRPKDDGYKFGDFSRGLFSKKK
jgi:hypothetical protein